MATYILTLLVIALNIGLHFCHGIKLPLISELYARDPPPSVPLQILAGTEPSDVPSETLPVTSIPFQTPSLTSEAPEKRAEDTACDGSSSCSPTTTLTARAPRTTSGRLIITFKDEANDEQVNDYIDALSCEVPEDKMRIVNDDEGEIVFVVVVVEDMPIEELKTEIVDTVQNDPVMHPAEARFDDFDDLYNCTEPDMDSYKRGESDIATSNLAPRDLRFVSQPKDPRVPIEKLENYAFPAKGGAKIVIYVLDSGLFLEHDEFNYDPKGKWTKGKIDFLQKRDDEGLLLQKTEPGDGTGHGTCMISRIVGKQFGACKAADIITGRFQTNYLGGYYSSSVTDTLFDAVKDIKDKRQQDPDYIGIVVLALYGSIDIPGSKKAYRRLNSLDVPTFISSGPDPKEQPFPRKHEKEFENFFIIGEVDDLGRPVPTTKLDNIVLTSAPGWSFDGSQPRGARCAGIASKNKVVTKTGSSFAVPVAAAEGAMSLTTNPELRVRGQVSKRLKAHLKGPSSYPRDDGLPRAVWNGINKQIS